MKANEEPKVLYLQPDSSHPAGKRHLNINKRTNNDIEYIRCDTFIDKATKWIDDNIFDYVVTINPKPDTYSHIDIEELLEEFRKAMKL